MKGNRMTKPLVSVAIAYHNAEEYLKRCVKSVLEQTYSKLEVLLIDNLSNDQSNEIAKSLAKQDSRIHLLSCTELGLAQTRNFTLQAFKGDYLTFVDSDDTLLPQAIERMVETALERKADLICASYCTKLWGKEKIRRSNVLPSFESDKKEKIHAFFLNEARGMNHSWGKLYAREVIKDIAFPTNKLYEDIAVLPEILQRTERVVSIQEPLYVQTLRKESLSYGRDMKRQTDGLSARLENASFYRENYPSLTKDAYDCALEFAFYLLGRGFVAGQKKETPEISFVIESVRSFRGEAARKGFPMKVALVLFRISPAFAGTCFALYSRIKNGVV